MIARLKRKFIIAAMASVFLVLSLLIGLINVLNYNSVNSFADKKLAIIAENEGDFPRIDEFRGEGRDPRPDMSPEAPFDTRYFTVTVNDDGDVTAVNTGRIAAVSTETAAEYGAELYRKGGRGGFIGDYKYAAVETDGDTMYIFLDCGRELDTFRSFLGASIGISAAGMVLVFILVWVLSGIVLKPARESYEKQMRFITDAGHEIKTPLTIIDASTELIELETGESKWTRSIRSQVHRLTGLTEKLVLLTKMNEDHKVQRIEFCLSDAVYDTAMPFEAVAVSGGKSLLLSVQGNVMYKGDEALVRQMLSLLLDNAMKYSDDGGRITVMLSESGRRVRLSVSNTVTAIEKGDHSELFERFYRPDSSRNSETGGHGIGLSVVKAIAEAHGGRATAVSDDGSSITFTVVM